MPHRIPRIFVALAALVILPAMPVLLSSCEFPSSQGPYGEIVRFSEHTAVQYPDFDVRYLGKRREVTQQYPRGFLYHDFEITSGNEALTASWTAGTGAVAPLPFSFGGKEYFLVLQINELDRKDPMLGKNEMIIWPRDAYLRALESSRNR